MPSFIHCRILLVFLSSLLLPASPLPAAPANPLPIYIEDNHAGSFHFLAETLPLDEPHTLVLFDAHTDASAVTHSDEIRTALRRVRSKAERSSKLQAWRAAGRIQPFDWIEPLMPAPFESVIWIFAESAPDPKLAAQQRIAARQLDGRLEAEPRNAGVFSHRFKVTDLNRLKESVPTNKPTVASIDLDYFAGTPPEELPKRLRVLLEAALTLPDLRAITFAISRPWLESEEEAHRLVYLALNESLALENATIRFEPFAPQGPDRSEMAKSYYLKGKTPPRYDITSAPGELQDLLLTNASRLQITHESERWETYLDEIRLSRGEYHLAPDDIQISADGIFRIPSEGSLPAIRTHANVLTPIKSVRWYQLVSDRTTYNVLPQLPAGKTFAGTAPPLIRYREIPLSETTGNALPARTWSRLLANQYQLGAIRLAAEITTPSGSHRTPPIEIRVTESTGIRAGISEQFGLPYVFGAGFLRKGNTTGPEAGGGNDCANFLAYASRRAGHHIPWCNPAQIRSHLEPIASDLTSKDHTPIPDGAPERGLVVHFHSHVGILWKDLPPLSSLGPEDIIAHHLSGPPEILPLADLLKSRPKPTYDILTFPPKESAVTITVAGDINLATPATDNPLPHLPDSDIIIANLECAVVARASLPAGRKANTFQFLAPTTALPWLTQSGIDLVSLANNHSADAPLTNTLKHLASHKIKSTGAGPNLTAALKPTIFQIKGVTVAVFAVSLINPTDSPATPTTPGIAVLPTHREELRRALRETANTADFILVLPHWGDEYTPIVTDSQRYWARWFIEHGAHAVVGSHTHHPQHIDTYRGRPIFYSLGNFYFPNKGPNKAFQTPALAHLHLDKNGRLTNFHQLPPTSTNFHQPTSPPAHQPTSPPVHQGIGASRPLEQLKAEN